MSKFPQGQPWCRSLLLSFLLLHSQQRYIQPMTEHAKPEPSRLTRAVEILKKGVEDRAFPGAVLAVGCRGRLAILTAGRLAYASDAAPVSDQTIYDLASLTKVVATATAAMILADRALLDIDRPVAAHLPD